MHLHKICIYSEGRRNPFALHADTKLGETGDKFGYYICVWIPLPWLIRNYKLKKNAPTLAPKSEDWPLHIRRNNIASGACQTDVVMSNLTHGPRNNMQLQ